MLAIEHFERLVAVRTGGQLVQHRRFPLRGECSGSVRGVFGECSGSVRGVFGECSGSVRGVFNEVRARTPGNEALALSNDSARGWRRDVD